MVMPLVVKAGVRMGARLAGREGAAIDAVAGPLGNVALTVEL
jgi:hypothetical protein